MSHLLGQYRKFDKKHYKAQTSFKRKVEAKTFARQSRLRGYFARVTKERDPVHGGYEYYVWMR